MQQRNKKKKGGKKTQFPIRISIQGFKWRKMNGSWPGHALTPLLNNNKWNKFFLLFLVSSCLRLVVYWRQWWRRATHFLFFLSEIYTIIYIETAWDAFDWSLARSVGLFLLFFPSPFKKREVATFSQEYERIYRLVFYGGVVGLHHRRHRQLSPRVYSTAGRSCAILRKHFHFLFFLARRQFLPSQSWASGWCIMIAHRHSLTALAFGHSLWQKKAFIFFFCFFSFLKAHRGRRPPKMWSITIYVTWSSPPSLCRRRGRKNP